MALVIPTRTKTKKKSGLVIPKRTKPFEKIATSTPTSRTVSLPSHLGGGEYKVGATPGDLIKTKRGYADLTTREQQERDHIISVALGGTSNKKNLQYLKTTDAGRQEGKVSVEQKAINDYLDGKITINQARLKVATKNQQIKGLSPTEKEQTPSGQIWNSLKDVKGLGREFLKLLPSRKATKEEPNVLSETMTSTPSALAQPTKAGFSEFVQEIPGATKQVGKEIAQSIARSFVATSQGAFNIVNNSKGKVFVPETPLQKKIFGEKPVNFESIGRETADIIGKGESINKTTAIGLGMAISSLDIYPGSSSSKNAIKKTSELIAKSSKVDDIIKLLNGTVKGDENTIRTMAESLTIINDPKKIEGIITKIKETPVIKPQEQKTLDDVFKEPRIAETETEAIAKRFTTEERKAMEDFIDVSRGVKKVAKEEKLNIEQSAQNIAERLKLDEAVSGNKKLANKFDELLTEQRNEFKQAIKQVEAPKKPADPTTTSIQKAKAEGKSFDSIIKPIAQAETGKPIVIKGYHGTPDARFLEEFNPTKKGYFKDAPELLPDMRDWEKKYGKPGQGFKTDSGIYKGISFTDDYNVAKSYSEKPAFDYQNSVPMVVERNITLKNPKVIDVTGKGITKNWDISFEDLVEQARREGHDGVIFKGIKDNYHPNTTIKPSNNVVIFDEKAIKTKSQLKQLWDKTGTEQAFGAVAGVETDEEGNIVGVSPEKAVLGVLGMKAGKTLSKAKAKYGITGAKTTGRVAKDLTSAKTTSALARGVEKLLTPISTRLGKISPELKIATRKLDFDTGQDILKDTNKILPMLKKASKFSAEDKQLFDLARKNGDEEVIQAIAEKYNIAKELKETRAVLDDLFKRGNEVGMEVGYKGDYFPRIVKDTEKFMQFLYGDKNWSAIEEALKKKAESLGIAVSDMSIDDKAHLINSMLRGYGDKITLSAPGSTKERTIDFVTQSLDRFYETSDSALVRYVNVMNTEIAGRKFFGKELGNLPENLTASDSIGAYVMRLLEGGKITPTQEKEVSDILKARFNKGKMNEALQAYRNVEYISTMGNPISAITQIGDLSWSLYDNGFYKTIKGVVKSISGKGIKKEELGIERIAQEFTEPSKTSKLVENVFKIVGLSKMDNFGKQTFINANWDKIQGKAKKLDDGLIKDLKTMFGGRADEVLSDLKAGKLTDDAKFMLFQRLGDFQPIAKAEMPEKYLSMPNGRIFYMLKSFTLKQIDIFRREAIDKIASGNAKEVATGIKNLVKLTSLFMLANATADQIKDLVLNRETALEDRVIDNLLRAGGLSKFDVYQIREEGLGSALIKKILFPLSIADAISKDIENITTGKEYKAGKLKGEDYKLETTQRIPVVGKMYYWWLGRGKQKQNYKESEETGGRTKELDKIFNTGGTSRKSLDNIFK